MVLILSFSLREICERIAIKAPHHTYVFLEIPSLRHSKLLRFYSWRRYCNKHQIRLGGYIMNNGPGNANDENQRSESAEGDWDMDASDAEAALQAGPSAESMFANGVTLPQNKPKTRKDRSPTPPRALFRSTTGKGVAFTAEDRDFLISFMDYRRSVSSPFA